jgi:hypothetical protein
MHIIARELLEPRDVDLYAFVWPAHIETRSSVPSRCSCLSFDLIVSVLPQFRRVERQAKYILSDVNLFSAEDASCRSISRSLLLTVKAYSCLDSY